jgi:hypothetical protein
MPGPFPVATKAVQAATVPEQQARHLRTLQPVEQLFGQELCWRARVTECTA